MAHFFEKEKKKIEEKVKNHKETKEKKKKENEGAPFYKNVTTGAIISRQEYMDMNYEKELEMNNIMQPNLNGINDISSVMDEDIVNSEYGTYVPYYPDGEDNQEG